MSSGKSICVLFVCHGNICRSPAAEGTFRHLVEKKGLSHIIKVDSAGTHSYHVGEQPHSTTRNVAGKRGIQLNHRARQFHKKDFEDFDYILTMDQFNHEDVLRLADTDQKHVMKFRKFDPQVKDGRSPDVPDPYYGGNGGFEGVQDIMDRTAENLLNYIIESHKLT
ncbi:MAG: low molecular weight phosphotyrosine protein phosphatase [Spirochaetia bacterium]|nr:low molecular weight phosphotyrosine protein phosphatase [Spirochaetia bacterium]